MSTDNIKLYDNSGKELKDSDLLPSRNERLNVLYINEYINRKFNSDQNNNLKKGFYILNNDDMFMIRSNLDSFWSFIANNSGLGSGIFDIISAVGLTKDGVKSKQAGDKIFIPSRLGLGNITEKYIDSTDSIVNPIPRLDLKYIQKLKIIMCYANFLGGDIASFSITSTRRTIEQQADIMIRDYFSKNKRGLYGSSEKSYFDILENLELGDETQRLILARQDLINNVDRQKNNPITGPGFHHTNPSYTIVDIHPDSIASKSLFLNSLDKFKGKYIYHYLDPSTGDSAYHIVFQ